VGLVDAALAAASAGYPGDRLLLVDLHLHRASLTELRQGQEVVRERVATIDHFGVDEVNEALAGRIAELFVRQARFDPLHSAPTEQALHDRLPEWLARLAHEDTLLLALPADGREVEIHVARADVEEWARPFTEALGQEVALLRRAGESTTLLLTPRAAALPGLVGRLGALRGAQIRLIPEHAAAAGALRERAGIPASEGFVFVTRLARPERTAEEGTLGGGALVRPPAPVVERPVPIVGVRRPTHLLFGHRARVLTADPLVVGTAPPDGARALRLEGDTAGISRSHCRIFESTGSVVVEDLSTYGTFLNDERVEGRAVLTAGDRLRLGSPGIELLLVAAEEG
jgi:FHA domain